MVGRNLDKEGRSEEHSLLDVSSGSATKPIKEMMPPKFGEPLRFLDKAFKGLIWVIVVLVLLTPFCVLSHEIGNPIKSKKRLEPRLEIVVENGVADTTFIYEKP